MDIFCEQIVKKKKTTFEKLTVALIWLAGWFLAVIFIFFGLGHANFFMISLLMAAGALFGAIKLSARLNLEYEFSVTNGTLDVDKIINRSDRKRMLSAELAELDRFEEFDPQKPEYDRSRYDLVVVAVADPAGEEGIYAATLRHPVKGKVLLILQPGQKVLEGIQKCLPRNLQFRR